MLRVGERSRISSSIAAKNTPRNGIRALLTLLAETALAAWATRALISDGRMVPIGRSAKCGFQSRSNAL